MEKIEKEQPTKISSQPVVEKPQEIVLPTQQPLPTLAQHPGDPVKQPIILWAGAGNFFERIVNAGTFKHLLEDFGAHLTVIDIHPKEEIPAYKEIERQAPSKHSNIRYYQVSQAEQRRNLIYNRFAEKNRPFTHIYIATWPQAHLLSAVKYSSLCPGGDIIITKPLDLNIPMVKDLQEGVFPDLTSKVTVDDHYRNKGCVRELHRHLSSWITKNNQKLRGFRMWLVEPATIESENRLQALECGVIWDLATHLVSLIQLFFLDKPHIGLLGYTKGDPQKLHGVKLQIRKVLRKRYSGCELKTQATETLAVIEVAVTFQFQTYGREPWVDSEIPGILVVGKAATRGRDIVGPVKQIDFYFEGGPLNLNYNTGVIMPEIRGYNSDTSKENGFCQPVIELLTHTQRSVRREETKYGGSAPEPGRYHCGMSFEEAFQNVMLIDGVKNHQSGRNLLHSYNTGDDIHDMMSILIAQDFLEKEKNWMIERDFGKFI